MAFKPKVIFPTWLHWIIFCEKTESDNTERLYVVHFEHIIVIINQIDCIICFILILTMIINLIKLLLALWLQSFNIISVITLFNLLFSGVWWGYAHIVCLWTRRFRVHCNSQIICVPDNLGLPPTIWAFRVMFVGSLWLFLLPHAVQLHEFGGVWFI